MRVGELAQRSGSSATTIRYYEKLGLLPRASRSDSGYREYAKDALDHLALVRRAKELGFSLREIRALLARRRGISREEVLAAVTVKLSQLERERKALRSKERQLRELQCRVLRDRRVTGEDLTAWLRRPDPQMGELSLARSSLGHFDREGHEVIALAMDEARRYDHGWLGTEHLLLAFARLRSDVIQRSLASERLKLDALRNAFETVVSGTTASASKSGIFITPRVMRVMGIAEGIAFRDDRRATAEDLLLAMLEDGEGVAVSLIRACGGDPARIAARLRERLA